MQLVPLETVSLKDHPEIDERWIQDRIAEDPSILGLGDDLEVRYRERILPGSGRVDFVLEDPESGQRYVVEVQLGATDPSHIVRTIEYWDLERRRHPRHEHVAVLVAEEITGRFFNVVSLLAGAVPLVAIRMTGVRLPDGIGLVFTTVVDSLSAGPEDEEETPPEPVDRGYWERRADPEILSLVDRLVELVREVDPSYTAGYTRSFIGLRRNGRPDNVVVFRPRRSPRSVLVQVRLPRSAELEERFASLGLEPESYSPHSRRYRFRVRPGEFESRRGALREVIRLALRERGRLAEDGN